MNTTHQILQTFEFKEPLTRYEKLTPWTVEWVERLSPTNSQCTKWHLNKLEIQIESNTRITLAMLDDWILDGAEVTQNYISPRLKLAGEICYNSRGMRYASYRAFRMRFLKWTKAEIEAG